MGIRTSNIMAGQAVAEEEGLEPAEREVVEDRVRTTETGAVAVALVVREAVVAAAQGLTASAAAPLGVQGILGQMLLHSGQEVVVGAAAQVAPKTMAVAAVATAATAAAVIAVQVDAAPQEAVEGADVGDVAGQMDVRMERQVPVALMGTMEPMEPPAVQEPSVHGMSLGGKVAQEAMAQAAAAVKEGVAGQVRGDGIVLMGPVLVAAVGAAAAPVGQAVPAAGAAAPPSLSTCGAIAGAAS